MGVVQCCGPLDPLIMAIRRWPRFTRCRTALSVPARSSMPTTVKPGRAPPTVLASGTPRERSAADSSSSGMSSDSSASTRLRTGILVKKRLRVSGEPRLYSRTSYPAALNTCSAESSTVPKNQRPTYGTTTPMVKVRPLARLDADWDAV